MADTSNAVIRGIAGTSVNIRTANTTAIAAANKAKLKRLTIILSLR
jgi:hypothetical protein